MSDRPGDTDPSVDPTAAAKANLILPGRRRTAWSEYPGGLTTR